MGIQHTTIYQPSKQSPPPLNENKKDISYFKSNIYVKMFSSAFVHRAYSQNQFRLFLVSKHNFICFPVKKAVENKHKLIFYMIEMINTEQI